MKAAIAKTAGGRWMTPWALVVLATVAAQAAAEGPVEPVTAPVVSAVEPMTPEPRTVAAAWAAQREQVLDLLVHDTRQALAALQAAPAPTAGPPAARPAGSVVDLAARPALPSPPHLQLRGLFGTEPHYTVLLAVDGQLHTYRPGASLPLNGRGRRHDYRLVRVIDRCVVVRRGARGPLRTACYQSRRVEPDREQRRASADASALPSLNQPLPQLAQP